MRKLRCVLHIGLDTYPPLSEDFATKPIWQELAKAAEKYLVIARSRKNRFERYRDGNLEAYWVPKLTQPLYAVTSLYAVCLAWKYKPEVIVVQEPIIGGTTARLCRFVSGSKLLMEVHSEAYFFWKESGNPYLRLLAWLAFTNLAAANRVRALTPGFKRGLMEVGLPADRLTVLPTRVSLSVFDVALRQQRKALRKKFHLPREAIIFVTTGRYTPDKNQRLLLLAFARLRERLPNTFLVLVGEGPLRGQYEQWIKRERLERSVRLTGSIPPRQVAEYLATAEVYIHPSVAGTEALPRAILEAMAMGLPVIATNVAGIPEVVQDHVTGTLIPPDDALSLGKEMERIALNQHQRDQLGQSGMAVVQKEYEWEKNFNTYRQLLLETAGST